MTDPAHRAESVKIFAPKIQQYFPTHWKIGFLVMFSLSWSYKSLNILWIKWNERPPVPSLCPSFVIVIVNVYTVSNSDSECFYFATVIVNVPTVIDSGCPYSYWYWVSLSVSDSESLCSFWYWVSLQFVIGVESFPNLW